MKTNKNYWVWPCIIGLAISFAMGYNVGFTKALKETQDQRPVVISPICQQPVKVNGEALVDNWGWLDMPDAGMPDAGTPDCIPEDPCAWPKPTECRCEPENSFPSHY